MKKLTMEQALAVADTLCVQPEVMATDGVRGELSIIVPNFTKPDAEGFLKVAMDGFDLDWRTVSIVQSKMEDSDIPLAHIIITTEN